MSPLARLLLSSLLVLSSCSRTADIAGGGNDFPNSNTSAAALGAEITSKLAKGDNWSDSVAVFTGSTSLAQDSSFYVPQVCLSPVAKNLRGGTSRRFDYSDTAGHGIVYLYYDDTENTIIRTDTAILLFDAAFRTSAPHLYLYKGKSVLLPSGIIKAYLYRDADGDSIINNPGGTNRLYSAVSITAFGLTQKTEVIVDGGPDNNLITWADNRIRMVIKTRLEQNNDTLSSSQYFNYAGDSVIIDPAKGDSFEVRILTTSYDSLRRSIGGEAVFMVFPSDSTKNYPLYIRNTTRLKSGGTRTCIIHRPRADSLLAGLDTAAAETILEAPSDSVRNDTLRMSVLLGRNVSDPAANSLASLNTHIVKTGVQREKLFWLFPDAPCSQGRSPQSGAFTLRVKYSSGDWVTVLGNFNPSAITGAFADSLGDTMQLTWDRSGVPMK